MKADAYFMEPCDAWQTLSLALVGDRQGGGQQTLDHWEGDDNLLGACKKAVKY